MTIVLADDRAERDSMSPLFLRELPPPYQPGAARLAALSDAELLAGLIRRRVERCAELLERHGGWVGLSRLSMTALVEGEGLRESVAERLRIALEIGRRLPFPPALPRSIRMPQDLAHLLLAREPSHHKQVYVVVLSSQHEVIAVEHLYTGTVDRVVIRPAEVFRTAVSGGATVIAVAHTQPSGDPAPSPEDLLVTQRLIAAGRLLEVDLLDHLMLGNGRWLSLRAQMPELWRTTTVQEQGHA